MDARARTIIERLAAVDHHSPVIDRPRVEQAIAEHLRRVKLSLPVEWADDAEQAFHIVYSAAWSAAGSAAR